MTERFDDPRSFAAACDPRSAPVTADPIRIGGVRSQGEALDDALGILAFVRVGLASGAIDPDRTFWVVDLAPADGERAWRVMSELRERNLRGPAVRYLARCRDGHHRRVLSAHPPLQPLLSDGRLALDDIGRWLRVTAPGNPIAVLAHDAISAEAQRPYRVGAGALLEAVREDDGPSRWRPAVRRDGPARLLAAHAHWPESVEVTLPVGAIGLLGELLALSGGRLLLRASDIGVSDPEAIRRGALAARDAGIDPGGRLPVNFDALARWHRAHGARVVHDDRSDSGRVLHLAVHDREDGRLHECASALIQAPHPDDHVAMLEALAGLETIAPAQGLSLLHALQADPRALRAMAHALPPKAQADAGATRSRWRRMLERCRDRDYPTPAQDVALRQAALHREAVPRGGSMP